MQYGKQLFNRLIAGTLFGVRIGIIVLVCICSSPYYLAAPPLQAAKGEVIFQTLSPAQASQLMKKRKELIVIDVRTPQEQKKYHIAGSYLVPLADLIRGKHKLSKDQAVLLYCAVGGRSALAANILNNQGFQEVYNLAGGIESWLSRGLAVEISREPVSPHQ